MIARIFAFFLACCVLSTASHVIEADNLNFDEIISKPDTYSFVEFYALWCGHCKNLAPVWEELAETYAKTEKIQIVKIDADVNNKIGRRYGIRGFPTLKIFYPGEKKPRDYEGKRELDSFKTFLTHSTGIQAPAALTVEDHVTYLDDVTLFDKIRGKHAFISITASWCGYCKKLKPEWVKLANVFKNDGDAVLIGDVITSDVNADKILEKFEVQSFPTIVYIDGTVDPEAKAPESYVGGRDLDSFVQFVNEKSNIGRKSDGTLDFHAGKLSVVDEYLIKLSEAAHGQQSALISQANQELAAVKDVANAYSVKYYGKLLDKLKNGETDYFQKEYNRLNNMLTKNTNAVSGKIYDNLVKRINILKGFLNLSSSGIRDEL